MYSAVHSDLVDEARFLQQVLVNHGSLYHSLSAEMDVNVLAKSAGVVVAVRLGISKG